MKFKIAQTSETKKYKPANYYCRLLVLMHAIVCMCFLFFSRSLARLSCCYQYGGVYTKLTSNFGL